MAKANEARMEADAKAGNYAMHIRALTLEVLRHGSSLMTTLEARTEAVRLYRMGRRAGY
jgi:hypothetical protein